MQGLRVCLAIGTIALAAAACGDQGGGKHAEGGPPGLEQEARGLEKAAEEGAAARAAAGAEKDVEQAAESVEKHGVEASAKDVGKELEGNVERSARTYDDTYRKDRAAGEGAVDAAGGAYESVLDEPDEKAAE